MRALFKNGWPVSGLTRPNSARTRCVAVLIYRRIGNLRAVQLLLGHTKIESTVRYLGIEVDDAIEIAEKIDI
jgi:site-specific recombinase XerC